ncbi:hypothetical protein Lbir_3059 [Legionella birminghamensis]|uniref:Uncharacterized protein n=1 Tax=Legionella birminghamensis TaxID=28083 RepID=A0A378ID84_9GAMM|nr:hypothetical protein [Legionella birminghamensis]KTC66757.1 hypothetical protein Lbir_3059 [Legionella birminghamensis]STX32906.1 Uncharacterised protein [Legionella birminghamensis]
MQLSTKLTPLQIEAAAFWWKLLLLGVITGNDPQLSLRRNVSAHQRLQKQHIHKANQISPEWPSLFEQTLKELLLKQNEENGNFPFSLELNSEGLKSSSFLAQVIRELKNKHKIEVNIFMFPIRNIRMDFIDQNHIVLDKKLIDLSSFVRYCIGSLLMHNLLISETPSLPQLSEELNEGKISAFFGTVAYLFRYHSQLKAFYGNNEEAIRLELMKYRDIAIASFESTSVHRKARETVDDAMIQAYTKPAKFGHSRVTIPFFKPAITENTISQAAPGNTLKPAICVSEKPYASDDNLAVIWKPR